MPKGVKGFKTGHKHSEETKKKIGEANKKQIYFNCDYCGKESSDKPSNYKRKKRHFCSTGCYSLFRKEKLPFEEQHRYGTGIDSLETKAIKRKARRHLNHAVRDGVVKRQPCEVCGELKSEAHHSDYSKPLEVRWLCFYHHRLIHENPELLGEIKSE